MRLGDDAARDKWFLFYLTQKVTSQVNNLNNSQQQKQNLKNKQLIRNKEELLQILIETICMNCLMLNHKSQEDTQICIGGDEMDGVN